jgi:hypothetical protein
MAHKEIRIFDTTNAVLKVAGISFELFDVATGALLSTDLSKDLKPGPGGFPSNEWGVILHFTGGSHPLEVYTTDPTYKYPGNTIQSLEGNQTDRIDIDLSSLPSTTGGQSTQLDSATPLAISNWVKAARNWDEGEKWAVRNLVFNYTRVIVPRLDDLPTSDLNRVATNWEDAMRRLGIEPDVLKR